MPRALLDCDLGIKNPARAGFLEGPTDAEKQVVGRHFECLRALSEQGVVLLAGRATNGFCGIVVSPPRTRPWPGAWWTKTPRSPRASS